MQPDDTSAEQLRGLLERLRNLAFDQHPLQDGSVTLPQLALLDAVAASPGSGVLAIAVRLGLTPATVSVHVQHLEGQGLLERQSDPRDGRAVRTFLTPAGRQVQEGATTFRQRKTRRLLAGLSAEETAQLLALLNMALTAAEAEQAH